VGPKSGPKSCPKSGPKGGTKSGPKSEPKRGTKSGPKSEPKSCPKSGPKRGTKSGPKSEPKSGPKWDQRLDQSGTKEWTKDVCWGFDTAAKTVRVLIEVSLQKYIFYWNSGKRKMQQNSEARFVWTKDVFGVLGPHFGHSLVRAGAWLRSPTGRQGEFGPGLKACWARALGDNFARS